MAYMKQGQRYEFLTTQVYIFFLRNEYIKQIKLINYAGYTEKKLLIIYSIPYENKSYKKKGGYRKGILPQNLFGQDLFIYLIFLLYVSLKLTITGFEDRRDNCISYNSISYKLSLYMKLARYLFQCAAE